jgi:hypothetical protein
MEFTHLKEIPERINSLRSCHYDTDRIENNKPNSSSIVGCVFIAAGKCLPSRCLGMLGEKIS